MNKKELLQIIQTTAKEEKTELDLSDNQLSELPPEIGQLTKLTQLDLSGNQLSELPPEIVQLTKLTTLDLSGNQLGELPPEKSTSKLSLKISEQTTTITFPSSKNRNRRLGPTFRWENPTLP
jgi:Leucine-rich repeat (LRR) protein